MVLIKKPQEIIRNFNREETLGEIIITLKEKYPDYQLIINRKNEQGVWDLLIIRTIEHTVHEVIGMMNHESTKQRKFQQVFAVRIEQAETDHGLDLYEFRKWVTQFIITDNIKTIIRTLELSV